jgi:hypothetical protein
MNVTGEKANQEIQTDDVYVWSDMTVIEIPIEIDVIEKITESALRKA